MGSGIVRRYTSRQDSEHIVLSGDYDNGLDLFIMCFFSFD